MVFPLFLSFSGGHHLIERLVFFLLSMFDHPQDSQYQNHKKNK